jgi:hypothetical protein
MSSLAPHSSMSRVIIELLILNDFAFPGSIGEDPKVILLRLTVFVEQLSCTSMLSEVMVLSW